MLLETDDLSLEMKRDLRAEELLGLQRQVPILYAVLGVNTLVLSYTVYGMVPDALALAFPAAFIGLIVCRAGFWLLARPAKPVDDWIVRRLTKMTTLAALVSAAVAAWSVGLLQYPRVAAGPGVPIFIGFGSIACAYCLSSYPRAAFTTIFFAAAPVCFVMLLSGDAPLIATAINLLLIFALFFRLIADHHQHLVKIVTTHARVRSLAYADPLTGAHNRRSFMEALSEATAKSQQGGQGFSLAMIDLDGFKSINDTFGHPTGDEVIIEAARRIHAVCRPGDIVARLGGDEFAVLFFGVGRKERTVGRSEELVTTLSQPFLVDHWQLRVTASVGIATCPEDGESTAEIVSRADLALYEAKRGGGNAALHFAPHMAARLLRRKKIEQSLRDTAPSPQIEVVFQPIHDLATRRIKTMEALARWEHPELGTIGPLEFIEAAERIGVIGDLSKRLFAVAIAEAAWWPADVGLSLNLSAVDLSDSQTGNVILSLLERSNFDPRRLEVEVTETSILKDFDIARRVLETLRARGVEIVLDDFGAGFASIGYLKEITFDRIKIDGEIVSNIVECSRSRQLLDGILRLCTATGTPATAEKIEHEAQMTILTAFGCDRVQGYLLGRPADAQTTRSLLGASTKGFSFHA